MIKYLKHNEVNRSLWDECVTNSEVNLPYALCAYLDVVSPDWGALVFELNNVYEWVFPLPIKQKWGLKYLSQPLFTQQLGFFYLRKPTLNEKELVVGIMKRRFWLLDIADNCSCETAESLSEHQVDRLTHLLDLSRSFDEIKAGYNSNRKRAVKSLTDSLSLEKSDSVLKLLQMFEVDKGGSVKGFGEEAKRVLVNLSSNDEMLDMFRTYYVVDDGITIAGGLFIEFNNKWIFLFGATSEVGKKLNAMTYLFNKVIEMLSNSDIILDFEGSLIDGVSKFYRSFGGERKGFKQLKYTKIPLFVGNEK